MNFLVCLFLITSAVMAETTTSDEQKKLVEENQMLRQEIKKLQNQAPADSAKVMDALKKGQKFQEEQNKALEELDKEY